MQPRDDKRRFSLFSKPLQSCIEPVMRPVIKKQGAAASKLISAWSEIVGADIAAHSLPTKLQFPRDKNSGGTLTLACEGAFAPTLQHMTPAIIERLTTYFGYPAVARIQLEQTLIPTKEASSKPVRKTSIPKLDTSSIDTVNDPELKQALASLADTLAGK